MHLLANQKTQQQIDAILTRPPHAIGIFGRTGSGKRFLAYHLAGKLLHNEQPTAAQQYIVRPNDNDVITIEQARGVLSFTKLKSHHKQAVNRTVIIEDAHKMTPEAQNALLKIIEEPPNDTILILTAENHNSLLATINSRLNALYVYAISKDEARSAYSNIDETEFNKAWLISNGRIGLLDAILKNDDNQLLSHIGIAKEILQSSLSARLSRIDELQKGGVAELLDALLIVAKAGRNQAAIKRSRNQTEKWQSIIHSVITSQNRLQHNPNQKMLLSNLMLEL